MEPHETLPIAGTQQVCVRCISEVPGFIIITACEGGAPVVSAGPQEADSGWEGGLHGSRSDEEREQTFDT